MVDEMLNPPGDAKSEEKPMVAPRANSNFPAFESLVASKCNQGTLSYSKKSELLLWRGKAATPSSVLQTEYAYQGSKKEN